MNSVIFLATIVASGRVERTLLRAVRSKCIRHIAHCISLRLGPNVLELTSRKFLASLALRPADLHTRSRKTVPVCSTISQTM